MEASATTKTPPQLDKILAQTSSITRLEQLCSMLGWGRKLFHEAKAGWVAEVTCGVAETHRFETHDKLPRTKKIDKTGKATVAASAVEVEIVESGPKAWARFLASLKSNSAEGLAVGIGTQGNDGDGLPILVQVATKDIALLELPRAAGAFSKELTRLLADASVTKVFCDSAARRDMKALGVCKDGSAPLGAGIVDLETAAAGVFGNSSASRGLGRIAGFVLGERIGKADPSAWADFEVKGTEAKNISEFADKARRHAAVEAHSTLLTWHAFCKAIAASKSKGGPVIHKTRRRSASDVSASVRRLPLSGVSVKSGAGASEADGRVRALSDIDDELRKLEAELRQIKGGSGAEAAEPAAAAPSVAKAAKKRKRARSAGAPPTKRKLKTFLDEELAAVGGALPWGKLRDALVTRTRGQRGATSDEQLGLRALANIPEAYLSKSDDLVRLPSIII